MNYQLNEKPLVSAIVPAFNAQQYIGATLESLIHQSYPHLEIIVADDGSTDHTVQIVKEWMKKDQRIRLWQQPNSGTGAARNLAIRHSRGSFIAPVDADDICYPDKIAKLLACLQKSRSQVGLAYSWYTIIDQEGKLTGISSFSEFEGAVFLDLFFSNFIGNASTSLIRKECFDRAGLYNTWFFTQQAQGCEDYDMFLRIAEHFDFKVVRECLTGYRKTGASMSANFKVMEKSRELVFKDQKIRNPWIPDIVFDWAAAFYCLFLARKAAHKKSFAKAIKYFAKAAHYDPMLLSNGEYLKLCIRSFVTPMMYIFENGSTTRYKKLPIGMISVEDLQRKMRTAKRSSLNAYKERRRKAMHLLYSQAKLKAGDIVNSCV